MTLRPCNASARIDEENEMRQEQEGELVKLSEAHETRVVVIPEGQQHQIPLL